jgi:hypothetical protein
MVWLLLGVVVFLAIAGLGMMRAPGGRAPNRLGNAGFPKPYDRDRHEQNDEE